MHQLSVLLVGIGGYGATYVRELSLHASEYGLKVVGAVDPYAKSSPVYDLVRTLTPHIYPTLEAFFAEHSAELAVISTPLPFHCPQAIYCMEQGAGVLVEKPIACTAADAERMMKTRDRTGQSLSVGYQWCCDRAMNALRRDIRAGRFGSLLSMRALVLWPRDIAYYSRGWTGKKYGADGTPVFDSVASNGTAHYLENMLWMVRCIPTEIECITARANPIETYDTIVLRGKLNGADMTYVASHCAGREHLQDPMFEYTFEKGTAFFGGLGVAGQTDPVFGKTIGHAPGKESEGLPLTVRMRDGSCIEYGPTYTFGQGGSKLLAAANSVRGIPADLCTAEDALLLTRTLEMPNQREAHVFHPSQILDDHGMLWVPKLSESLIRCYLDRSLKPLEQMILSTSKE